MAVFDGGAFIRKKILSTNSRGLLISEEHQLRLQRQSQYSAVSLFDTSVQPISSIRLKHDEFAMKNSEYS